MQNNSTFIHQTAQWIQQVIIKHNFCPFAARVVAQQGVDYQIATDPSPEAILAQLSQTWKKLEEQVNLETSFLIFPNAYTDFHDYLDLLHLAEAHLVAEGYEGVYQLASFHPAYLFAGSSENDPANYTNRSPYPMFHILREDSVEKAIAHHPNPEQIPEQNIELAKELGLEQMKVAWQNIFSSPAD